MATMTTPALPTPEALELMDYKLGTLGSDVDTIRASLEACAGKEGADRYDPDQLAHVIASAADLQSYAGDLQRDAEAIQRMALALYHENHPVRDSAGWDSYRATVRAWHEEEGAR